MCVCVCHINVSLKHYLCNMCVCSRESVCARWMGVCMHACMHACMCARMHVNAYVCEYMYAHKRDVCLFVYMYA